jgi:uncharacterized protein (UPF0548 family)
MVLFERPDPGSILSFISGQAAQGFSYVPVGATKGDPPAGFVVDHNRIELGRGKRAFDAACQAINGWKMFDLGWVEVFPSDAPIVAGTNVAVLARVFGVWFLNGCRIVYTVDDDGPVRSIGFAYGTLPEHAESGEERFTIEWHRRDDSVWYDLLAFSRPNQFLARIGYPVARRLQKRFAADSKQAVLRYTLSYAGRQ